MTNPTMTIDEYNSLETRFKKLREEFESARSNMGQTVFKNAVNKWFIQNPQFKIVFWSQYTPYFSDGDSCRFSVHETNFYKSANSTKTSLTDDDLRMIREIENVEYPTDAQKSDFLEKLKNGLSLDDALKLNRYDFVEICTYSHRAEKADKEAMMEFESFLDEELMLAIFGDHTTIYISPEEIRTVKCDHE